MMEAELIRPRFDYTLRYELRHCSFVLTRRLRQKGRVAFIQRGLEILLRRLSLVHSPQERRNLAATLARVFAWMAELRIRDAEQFRERLCRLFRQIAVGAQVRFDDLRR